MFDRKLFVRWIRVTWGGWVLGVPLIAALALLGEAVGIGGSQVLVGAGMGAGIGLVQGRAIRGVLGRWAPWFWSSAVGLALPFLVTDIAKVTGHELAYSLIWCVAIGGLIVGGWQALLMRSHFRKSGWWVAASALGWSLAAGTSAVSDAMFQSRSIRGLGGAVAYLGVIVAGGLLLGLVTGACLAWMPRRAADGGE